jgi:signal transduction histidine kinase
MFQIRSYMVVPVFAGEKLWGLLAAYQNSGTRHWKKREIDLLTQVGNQLGVAVQQAELLQQTKEQSSRLRTTVADLNAIVDNLGDGLLVIDVQSKITRCNPAFLALFNLEGVTPGLRINAALSVKLTNLIEQIKSHKEDRVTVEIELDNGRFGQASASSILKEGENEEGWQCLGLTILIRDVTFEREVNQMKTDFIATVSHELRTPLTSVLGFASIIQDKLDEIVIPAFHSSEFQPSPKLTRNLN